MNSYIRIDDLPEWETHDRIFSEEYMYKIVLAVAEAEHLSQTLEALPLMKRLHEGQFRKGPTQVPYINHPLMIACHAIAMGIKDDNILAASLLHDVCEDCNITPEELPVQQETKEIIRLLTFSQNPGETKTDAKSRYFSALRANGAAVLIKLMDRCNNVSMMATGFSRQRMIHYIHETEEHLVPLIYVLRNQYPDYGQAAFLLKYQLLSMLETLKRTLMW